MAEVMVKGNQILDGTIQTVDLANGAVTGAKIAAGQTIAGNLQVNGGFGINTTPGGAGMGAALIIAPSGSMNSAIAVTGTYINQPGAAAVCGLNNQATTAAANNGDFCYGIFNAPIAVANGKTNLQFVGAYFSNQPAPSGFVTNYCVRIGAPSGATNNYSLVVDGASSFTGQISTGGAVIVGNGLTVQAGGINLQAGGISLSSTTAQQSIGFARNDGYIGWPSGVYLVGNGANGLSIGGTSPTLTVGGVITGNAGFVCAADWYRLSTGNGIFSNSTSQGVTLPAGGPSDYATGNVFWHNGNMAVGSIVQMWSFIQAPSGSTTSGTATFMPGTFGTGLACSGYRGGRFIVIGNFDLIVGQVGSGVTLSLYFNGTDQNNRASGTYGAVAGAAIMVPIIYGYGTGTGGSLTVQIAWSLSGAGSIAVNTGVYSSVEVLEFSR